MTVCGMITEVSHQSMSDSLVLCDLTSLGKFHYTLLKKDTADTQGLNLKN
jgi:hypothetical protein